MTYPVTTEEVEAACAPYEYIDSMPNPDWRIGSANAALLELVPADDRLAADHLASMIEHSAGRRSEAFMKEEIRVIARHFPGLELAIMAVYDHMLKTAGGKDACACPAGAGTRGPSGSNPQGA